MIKELLLTTLLQSGDLYSTHIGETRGGYEVNPLMNGSGRYITSSLVITGETWSLTRVKGWKKKALIGGLIVWKGYVIQHNLRIKK